MSIGDKMQKEKFTLATIVFSISNCSATIEHFESGFLADVIEERPSHRLVR
jgi:hypothetical protein